MTITREEAIKTLKELWRGTNDQWYEETYAMAIEALSERTGKWICKGDDYAVCSECGGSSGTQFDGVERIPKTTAFCPNCGARMLREDGKGYKLAIEQMEHDAIYEPTYSSEDGSM